MVNIEAVEHKLGVKLFPHQRLQLDALYNEQFPILKGDTGTGKSYLLAVYTALSLLQPFEKNKIVVTGPGFRNSKHVFEETERILQDAKINTFTVMRESDRYLIKNEQHSAYFLPLGNGEKSRGLRPNILLVDAEEQMDEDVLDTVYCGMQATGTSPIKQIEARVLGCKVYDGYQIVRARRV